MLFRSGLFSSFTTNTAGAAGTELTADLLFKAQAQLRTLSVPAPYYGVFHPKAVFNLKKTLTQAGYGTSSAAISELGNEALRNGYIGKIAGIDVFENANLSIDVNDDSVGGVFHPASIGLAMKEEFKIETQRDASLRATEIVEAPSGLGPTTWSMAGWPISQAPSLCSGRRARAPSQREIGRAHV